MRRREFMTLVGGGIAWPLGVHAQPTATPVIGLLSVRTPEADALVLDAFKRGMSETGYSEGKNVMLNYRWADGDFDRLSALAKDLVDKKVAVISTFGGTSAAQAAKAATSNIPIVFAIGDDPVKFGLVTNLSRPDSNATGATNFDGALATKQLGLLRQLVPSASVIAVMANPNEPAGETQISDTQRAAKSVGQKLIVFRASTEAEIDTAFAGLVRQHAGALLLGANPFFFTRISQLTSLASRYRMPTMYWRRELAKAGGLVSYGSDPTEAYTTTGRYVGKILAGAKPSDLPVQRPTKFEFVINLRTAKTLGLEISPMLLEEADDVIE